MSRHSLERGIIMKKAIAIIELICVAILLLGLVSEASAEDRYAGRKDTHVKEALRMQFASVLDIAKDVTQASWSDWRHGVKREWSLMGSRCSQGESEAAALLSDLNSDRVVSMYIKEGPAKRVSMAAATASVRDMFSACELFFDALGKGLEAVEPVTEFSF